MIKGLLSLLGMDAEGGVAWPKGEEEAAKEAATKAEDVKIEVLPESVPSADWDLERTADDSVAELSCLGFTGTAEVTVFKAESDDRTLLVEKLKVSVPSIEAVMLEGMATGQKLHSCRPSWDP